MPAVVDPPNAAIVARFNAEGIKLIHHGRGEDAAILLRRCLQLLLDRIRQGGRTSLKRSAATASTAGPEIYSVPLPSIDKNSEMIVCPTGTFEVFSRFFQLSDAGPDPSLRSPMQLARASAVVLFNIGVCLHRAAIEKGVMRHFKTALSIYKQGWTMLLKHSQNDLDDSSTKILLAAYANNMGHCHSHLFQLNDAKKSHEILVAAISSLSAVERCCYEQTYLSFRPSVLYFCATASAGASAA